MDEFFLCPDCHAEHREPLDAALGHVARCLICAISEADGASPPIGVPRAGVEPGSEISVAA